MAILPDIQQELEQEYERFVEFGTLLDRRMRQYIVRYLHNKIEPGHYIIPDLSDRYYSYFTRALDDLFTIDGLLELATGNQNIKRQLVLDTLYWLRKSYDKAKSKSPYEDEIQRLEGWSITPLHVFVKRWPSLPSYLGSSYSREEIDHLFFKDRWATLIGSQALADINQGAVSDVERLLKDCLAQWDALLYAKILDYELRKLEEEKEEYVDLVLKKVEEYSKLNELVQPFTDYLGWDMSRDLWQETSFDILQEYRSILDHEESIQELADLLGRMRAAEIEIDEETYERTIVRQEWVVDPHSKAEVVGVHESDDLTNMLSSEASLLADPDTEMLFLKKYADKSLMTFKYEDRRLVKSEDQITEINQKVRQKEKGPFIICVDTSESMEGRPEQIAKVLCLAILKMAMHQHRKAYLINFSRGIETLDLHDIANSVDQIAAFLKMSFYGGTDATLALYEALRQLGSQDYQDADVLMVSDFIMYKIEDDVLQQIKYFQQNKGTQWHSLTLSTEGNADILSVFDTNWVYDPKEKGIIKSLTHNMESIFSKRY